ncbi:MAG: hypothetical protein M3401_14120 [Actinomycetota bacterium]|nr:hypothetical protein [Actinomycetota bacterium]
MDARDDAEDDTTDFETREVRAAGAQAAAIGGREPDVGDAPDEPIDEAQRPVREAGGGEEEGFEIAEHDLVRNASHDDGEGYPERDGFTPERESDRAAGEYGQADEEIHSDD